MMSTTQNPRTDLALSLASAWGRLERSLDASLAAARGIRFAEFRLLQSLADAPEGRLRRVDLAQAVGLTPTGVTRALQPLEKLHIVKTERSERDARSALACLTPAGVELLSDARGVIEDVMGSWLERVPGPDPGLAELVGELARDPR